MKNRALRVLSYLLTVCMICTCVPMAAFAVPSAVTAGDSAYEMSEQDVAVLAEDTQAPQIKNIIFMIPDGAGYGSYDFSNDVKVAGGFDDAKFPYKTPVDDSPMTLRDYHAGSSITLNVYNSMTDSAAAGTALSTGVKTINNYVGVDRRKMPRANLTEAAQSVGKATGIVSTYEWCHATPASFTAHSLQRTAYDDFFRQIENKGLQVVLGCGYGTVAGTIQNAVDNGYTVVATKAEMAAVKPGDKIWGNVYDSSFNFDIYNGEDTATLAEMTNAAITALSADEDGFFLMVEGSKVDTGGHSNSTHEMSSDYIAFDEAFKVAVDFAKGRNDTVVIAVPDHDTGELKYADLVASGNLAAAVAETQSGVDSALVEWGTGSHSTDNVPFWCYYPEGVTPLEGSKAFGEDYYGNPAREDYVVDNIDIARWAASFMDVDLDELTKELFVDVTDIGIYDSSDKKFTFNNGDKYVYKDEGVYYLNGVKTEMEGLAIVIEEKVYVPAEIIDEADWNYVNGASDGITGTGTKDDPFVIDDAWDFLEFTNNMINGETYSGKYFIQNADIDMASKPQYNGVLSDKSFAGYYDGKGYTLNVKIDTTASSSNAVIFGVNDGTIVNLGVTGEIKSAGGYAAFVRKNNTNGKIVNCFVNATVTSTGASGKGFTISSYGKIVNAYFGGFASHHPITDGSNVTNGYYVEGSYNGSSTTGTLVSVDAAKTTLAETLAGGLSSAATLLGGTTEDLNTWYYISGVDYPVLKVKTPEVTGITLTPSAVTVKRGESTTLTATVLGNYNPSQEIVWEINPKPESENTKLYEDGFFKIGEDETQGSFTVIAKSAVAGNFAISSTVTVDLASDPVIKEDGSRTHPYLVENEDDFMAITNDLLNGTNSYKNKYFKQTADIDMAGYEGYKGVYRTVDKSPAYFQGTYDGNGYVINVDIYIEHDDRLQQYDACLFGNIANATFLNMGVTGSIKSPGYVSTYARNMSQGCIFANCWTSAHIESIAKGFGSYPGNDASGFVRSPYAGAFVNCYSIGTLVSPGGTSHPIGDTSDSYEAVHYNNFYLGREFFRDKEQTELSPEEIENGFAALLNEDFKGAAEVATKMNSAGRKFVPSMFLPWIDEIGGPRHRERDDSSKISNITEDRKIDAVVIGSDAEMNVNGKTVEIKNLTVKDGASVTLGQGTYIIDEAKGNITASPNANVIVKGANKPDGYVEIDIGTASGTRYAEVNGFQYEIVENDGKYGVITSEDMLLQFVEKMGASLMAEEDYETTSTKYYYVDADNCTYSEIVSLDGYMANYNKYSIRKPDEKISTTALRFRARITKASRNEEAEYVIDEYGYIITLEEKLNNNDYSQLNFDFTIPGKTAYVTGAAYKNDGSVNKVFEEDDEVVAFVAAFHNIPKNAYGKRIVAKTYTKITVDGKQFTLYGEPMVTSPYAVAKDLVDSGTVSEGDELYDSIKEIIDDTVDSGFGNEAGGDTGDLWG